MEQTYTEQEKKDRLAELIVYIASRCGDDVYLGKTKLNKMLFFADFLYYQQHGEFITGQEYVHWPHGPVPKDITFLDKTSKRAKAGIEISFSQVGPYKQQRIVALRDPDMSKFDQKMIAFVDSIIKEACIDRQMSATEIESYSHETLGWIATENNEVIPYSTAYLKTLREQKVTDDDRRIAGDLARKYRGQYAFAG